MSPRLIILVLIAAALGVAAAVTHGFGLFVRPATGLTLSGNVDIRQVDLGFRVGGRISVILFDEGAHVSAGEVLARLDDGPYLAAAAAARAQVGTARAQLEKLCNGNRPQEIAEAKAQLELQQATLLRTKADFDRQSALPPRATTKTDLDLARQQYFIAQAEVAAAEQAYSLEREGARHEDIDAAAAQLRLAQAQSVKADIDLADTVLRAPEVGTILIRAREPGAVVQAGETLLTLTLDRPMRVRAYIDEPDLHRISPGMSVLVTTDGTPRVYHGTIGFIAPTAEFTPKTVQTIALRTDLVYRIRVIVNDPDDGLRQGAPVSVAVPDARAGS
ncbi:MAG: HlyD family efflux transporter periplasmic adaptor subunit [Methylovirgula sp.]